MAWQFSLSVECGEDKVHAETLASELSPLIKPVSHSVHETPTNAVWVFFWLDGDPSDEDAFAPQAEEVLKLLSEYKGYYRFGLAGLEVDEARTWDEVVEDSEQGDLLSCLVLSNEAYNTLGQPSDLRPFGLGWRLASN